MPLDRSLANYRDRLTICGRQRKADIIHVMEHGRIIESGSLLELLKQSGRYAEEWSAQMEAHPAKT